MISVIIADPCRRHGKANTQDRAQESIFYGGGVGLFCFAISCTTWGCRGVHLRCVIKSEVLTRHANIISGLCC